MTDKTSAKAGAPSLGTLVRLPVWLLSNRVWVLAIGHALLFTGIYWLSFGLRFDFDVPDHYALLFWQTLPWVLLVKTFSFYAMGHFHGWLRYVTFADLHALGRAAALSFLAMLAIDHLVEFAHTPRGILIIDFLVTVICLGSLRALLRLLREQHWPDRAHRQPALLVGADDVQGILAHQIHAHQRMPYRIAGFLGTDSRQLARKRLGNIPVVGLIDDAVRAAQRAHAKAILVTAGSISGKDMRDLTDACREAELPIKILPQMEDILSGSSRLPIRDVQINDLLRREPIQLDCEQIADAIKGKTVLVTGAGGSIGSEICRQLLVFEPANLVLVEKSEHNLFMIERELAALHCSTQLHPRIADITDRVRMAKLFENFQPDLVFHAAAHKHVPMMEHNVGEAIKNNVFGTRCIADLAHEYGVARFVMISTDKAVHPSSVMGVSKQIAERYVHSLSQGSSTRFMCVRFGNVLGSAGSVVPVFLDQIRAGGPVTITDPRMTRFFMTIPEASQLVLQAGTMGIGGEIFVLDMGEPVKILDLARDLIRLSGLPDDAVDIEFCGLRPGEKLYEELYFADEETLSTPHPKVRAAYHRPYDPTEVRRAIAMLEGLVDGPEEALRARLREIVPEYETPRERAVAPDASDDSSLSPTLTGAPPSAA